MPRAALALLLALLVPPGAVAHHGQGACDPTGQACVVDASEGSEGCTVDGERGVGETAARADTAAADAGAALWRACSRQGTRTERTDAFGLEARAAGGFVEVRWFATRIDDPYAADDRRVLSARVEHAALGAGEASWTWWDRACGFGAHVDPTKVPPQRADPGCPAGAPPPPPGAAWGRMLP